MEGIILKTLILAFKILSVPCIVIYCIFFEKRTITEVLHDEQVQTSLNVLAISFYSYFTYLKIFCKGVDVHTMFENIFFYVGGFLTMAWGIYRVLAQIEDYKTKKNMRKYNKELLDETSKNDRRN